jgi:hypothetical protein
MNVAGVRRFEGIGGKRATGNENSWLFKGSRVSGAIYVCRDRRLKTTTMNNPKMSDMLNLNLLYLVRPLLASLTSEQSRTCRLLYLRFTCRQDVLA